jgi:HSP20 family molecular chaperone IbpA
MSLPVLVEATLEEITSSNVAYQLFVQVASQVRVTKNVRVWHPNTDVLEGLNAYWVMIEIAGMKHGQFDVSMQGHLLVVSGVRVMKYSPEMVAYHQMEVNYGDFRCEIYLPKSIDLPNLRSRYEDGFLRLWLPFAP